MTSSFERWASTVRAEIEKLSTLKFDYPIGVNELFPPSQQTAGVPPELKPLYEVCDGLSAPDIYVGYFLDRAARVCSVRERGEPTRIEGRQTAPITVFGSDGGGGRFALCHADNSVLYLPSGGSVEQGAYHEDSMVESRRVGDDLAGFLDRLASDIAAFVANKVSHRYMVASGRTDSAG